MVMPSQIPLSPDAGSKISPAIPPARLAAAPGTPTAGLTTTTEAVQFHRKIQTAHSG